jgi:hypothetical protein
MNKNITIAIYTPRVGNSGGVLALHNLAQRINKLKYKNISAKLICMDSPPYNNEYCNEFMHPSNINNETVVVYPEMTHGNPLNAKHIIRWILMELNENIDPIINLNWNKNDIVYHWEPSMWQNGENNNKSNIKINHLTVPFIDKTFIKYNNNERTKTCYIIKKAHRLHSKDNFVKMHPNDSIYIEHMNIHEINKTFNECHTFYCYDPNTFYSLAAPLCGCITVLYPLEHMNKEEYFKNRNHYKDNGIAYGNSIEEINYAKRTLNDTRVNINNILLEYELGVQQFLIDIYEYHTYNKRLITVDDAYIKKILK